MIHNRALFLSLTLAFTLPLTACGGEAPSGGLTPDQNAQLDAAAAELDDRNAQLPGRGADETPEKPAKP